MTTDNDFKTLRRYSRQDAATILHAKDSWLRRWVTEQAIPHQRSGQPGPRQRGVWFTYDDILAIGRLMPSLMTTRQANSLAEGDPVPTTAKPDPESSSLDVETPVASASALTAEQLQVFDNLVSLRA